MILNTISANIAVNTIEPTRRNKFCLNALKRPVITKLFYLTWSETSEYQSIAETAPTECVLHGPLDTIKREEEYHATKLLLPGIISQIRRKSLSS